MAEQRGLQVGAYRDRTSTAQELQVWRVELIRRILRILVFVGGVTVLAGSYYRLAQGNWNIVIVFVMAYGGLLFITYNKGLQYRGRVWGIMGLLLALTLQDFIIEGRTGGGRLFLLVFVFTAALFLGERQGIDALVLSLGINIIFAILYVTGAISPQNVPTDSTELSGWISSILILALLSAFLVASINYLVPRLIVAMSESGHLARELTDYQGRLEDLVAQQEIDLSRRGMQLQTAAQVAREAAAFQDLDQVLEYTVHLISDRFNFYHAGIYLIDAERDAVVLRAASSAGGQVLLVRGHTIKLGAAGIVAYAATRGEPHMALDVGEDAAFVYNEDLPDTRSEIALPLQSRESIIGVLDVQSTKSGAFNEDDVLILRTLADQVALVISNSCLVRETESQLEAERQTYHDMSRRSWLDVASSLVSSGYQRNQRGVAPVTEALHPRMMQAITTSAVTLDEEQPVVSLPILVRGQVVGVIDARKPGDKGAWTQDELTLLETITTQLDTALDNAQLYQKSQLLANRERFTREIADRMRRAVDMDDLIRITVEEVATMLDAPVTFVQLIETLAVVE